MPLTPQARHENARWRAAVVSLLPLALLFVAFAAGVTVPMWLYLLVIAWSLLLLLGTSSRDPQARRGDQSPPRPNPGSAENLTEQRNALHRLADAIDPRVFEVDGQEVAPAGLVLHGRLRASPDDVQRHVGQRAAGLLGREPLPRTSPLGIRRLARSDDHGSEPAPGWTARRRSHRARALRPQACPDHRQRDAGGPGRARAVRVVRTFVLGPELIVFFIAGRPGMPPMEDVTRLDVPRRAVAWGSGSTAPTCDVRSLERYEMTFAKPDD